MKMHPAAVVAGWGLGNGALAAVLAGFGGTSLEWPVYLASAGLVLLNAVLIWAAVERRKRRSPRAWHDPLPGDSVFFLALGIIIASLGWAYSWYFLPVAGIPFIVAGLRERTARSRRGPRQTAASSAARPPAGGPGQRPVSGGAARG